MHQVKLPLGGALWMAASLLSFIGMAVAARELSKFMSIFEILFFRSLVGLIIIFPVIYQQRTKLKQTHDLGLQIGRNAVHFAGQYAWTIGVASLPLVKVFALEFTTPIWVSLLAFLFLKEKLSTTRVFAAIGGFLGVLVVLRPGLGSIEPAAFIVLMAAMGYATSIIMVKKLTLTSSPTIIVIWMVLLQLPLGLGLSLAQWRTPTLACIPWILLLGITGLGAHFAMAKALSIMEASIAIPIDFFRVPLIAVVGFFLYGEPLEIWVLVGAVIIFASNYLTFRVEQKGMPSSISPSSK
ncbi:MULTISPECIES: DMT family transporter [unclassified Pseudomonas]|uniref:DMT family transporter n=1 Tax=unclassified Pseudomonas TaxID=196821 RepID=UPI0030DBFE3A